MAAHFSAYANYLLIDVVIVKCALSISLSLTVLLNKLQKEF